MDWNEYWKVGLVMIDESFTLIWLPLAHSLIVVFGRVRIHFRVAINCKIVIIIIYYCKVL